MLYKCQVLILLPCQALNKSDHIETVAAAKAEPAETVQLESMSVPRRKFLGCLLLKVSTASIADLKTRQTPAEEKKRDS